MTPCAPPCALFPTEENSCPNDSGETLRSGFAGKRRKRGESEFSRLRGSERCGAASDDRASIARGCPPRTSPPFTAAVLRAEARTHFVAKSDLLETPCEERAFLAPLPCSSASNGIRFAGIPFERIMKRRNRLRKKTENGT